MDRAPRPSPSQAPDCYGQGERGAENRVWRSAVGIRGLAGGQGGTRVWSVANESDMGGRTLACGCPAWPLAEGVRGQTAHSMLTAP